MESKNPLLLIFVSKVEQDGILVGCVSLACHTHVFWVIKNSLSFCLSFSLSFPYYLPAELRIINFEI